MYCRSSLLFFPDRTLLLCQTLCWLLTFNTSWSLLATLEAQISSSFFTLFFICWLSLEYRMQLLSVSFDFKRLHLPMKMIDCFKGKKFIVSFLQSWSQNFMRCRVISILDWSQSSSSSVSDEITTELHWRDCWKSSTFSSVLNRSKLGKGLSFPFSD